MTILGQRRLSPGERVAAPFLSLVLTGRNDNYGGDFNARLAATPKGEKDPLVGRFLPQSTAMRQGSTCAT